MANIDKSYIDLSGLTEYDKLIKTHISAEDAKSYKTILLDTSTNTINFYKKYNATSLDTADFSIRLGTIVSDSYIPSFSGSSLVFSVGQVSSGS